MPYKNIKAVLTDATKFPAAVEAMLPEGAPKVSTMLLDAADKIPAIPDFPIEIPDLPAPPELPASPIGAAGLKPYVSGVELTPVAAAPAARAVAVRPESEKITLVYE